VLGVITKLKEEEGIACILVTHDMAFAAKAADRVAYFENGVIAEEGDPRKLLLDPETQGLRDFVAAVRF
jgi:polar amino acid transport system ATP-binding protein